MIFNTFFVTKISLYYDIHPKRSSFIFFANLKLSVGVGEGILDRMKTSEFWQNRDTVPPEGLLSDLREVECLFSLDSCYEVPPSDIIYNLLLYVHALTVKSPVFYLHDAFHLNFLADTARIYDIWWTKIIKESEKACKFHSFLAKCAPFIRQRVYDEPQNRGVTAVVVAIIRYLTSSTELDVWESILIVAVHFLFSDLAPDTVRESDVILTSSIGSSRICGILPLAIGLRAGTSACLSPARWHCVYEPWT